MIDELTQLVPHRGSMLLIDELKSVTKDDIECSVEITEDSAFCEEGLVPSYIGMEYIAQTIATYSGYHEHKAGTKPSVGFLLGVREYKAKRPHFKLGDKLSVKAKSVFIEGGLGSFTGSISLNEEELVFAKLTTFKPTEKELHELKAEIDG